MKYYFNYELKECFKFITEEKGANNLLCSIYKSVFSFEQCEGFDILQCNTFIWIINSILSDKKNKFHVDKENQLLLSRPVSNTYRFSWSFHSKSEASQ